MACQCDENSGGCSCVFVAGLNVTLEGGGTVADPVRVSVNPAYLQGVNGLNTIVTVAGTGDVQDPYLVRVEIDPAATAAYWTRWYGSRLQLNSMGGVPPGTLAVVIPGA